MYQVISKSISLLHERTLSNLFYRHATLECQSICSQQWTWLDRWYQKTNTCCRRYSYSSSLTSPFSTNMAITTLAALIRNEPDMMRSLLQTPNLQTIIDNCKTFTQWAINLVTNYAWNLCDCYAWLWRLAAYDKTAVRDLDSGHSPRLPYVVAKGVPVHGHDGVYQRYIDE